MLETSWRRQSVFCCGCSDNQHGLDSLAGYWVATQRYQHEHRSGKPSSKMLSFRWWHCYCNLNNIRIKRTPTTARVERVRTRAQTLFRQSWIPSLCSHWYSKARRLYPGLHNHFPWSTTEILCCNTRQHASSHASSQINPCTRLQMYSVLYRNRLSFIPFEGQ